MLGGMNRGAPYEFGRESADHRLPRQHGPRFTIRMALWLSLVIIPFPWLCAQGTPPA